MKKLFLLLSLCCMSFAAWADEYTDENGVIWSYYIYDDWDEAIQRYNQYAVISGVSNYETTLTVPATIPVDGTTYEVQRIGNGAFSNKYDIASIVLPESIRMIEGCAFLGCQALENINIPNNVTDIWEHTFQDCKKLKQITLPEELKNIWNNAFCGCLALTNITIPNNVTSIGGYTFVGCSSLINITIPNSVTTIGEYAYSGCSALKTVTLPEGIKTLSPNLFQYCSSLSNISVPSSVTTIGQYAFDGCYALSITLPSSVKSVAPLAFNGCTVTLSQTDPSWLNMNANSDYFDGATIIVPDVAYTSYLASANWERYTSNIYAASEMVERTFTDDNGVTWNYRMKMSDSSVRIISAEGYTTTVDVPGTLPCNEQLLPVTAIECSFQGHDNIVTVDLSKTSIKTSPSFSGWSALTSISYPSTLQDLSLSDCGNCPNLHYISLQSTDPTSLTITENSEYYYYFSIVVPDDAYTSYLASANWEKYVSRIYAVSEMPQYTYTDQNGVTWAYKFKISDSSVRITGAEGYTTNLSFPATLPYKETNLPVNHIGISFSYNENLITVDLSATKITSVRMGGMAWGGDMSVSFYDCPSLQTVILPSTIEAIGSQAFYRCPNLQTINWEDLTSLKEIEYSAFSSDWESRFSKMKVIDLSSTQLEAIGSNAFQHFENLQEVKFPSSLEAIGSNAFYGCSQLNKIDLSHTQVSTIEFSAFRENYNLQTVKLPASLKSITSCAFASNSSLRDINLSNVEVIGERAFEGCNNLNEIDLSSVTSVGIEAFTGNDPFFNINNTTPATISASAFPINAIFLVPGTAIASYKSASVWSSYASRIIASNIAVQTINVTAQANGSGVLEAIGGSANQTNIIDLTVKGTINGYDFVMFKDKMLNLRFLDLSEATVVYNPYRYYEYNYSQNDTLGAYAFNQENKLVSIKLPKGIKHIGSNAFAQCYSLREVVFGDKLESIGSYAFSDCNNLDDITLPNGLRYIGSDAFSSCSSLSNLTLPNTVKRIEYGTFQSCSNLKELTFPNQLEYIGGYAFCNTGLKEVVFPTTLKTIDYGAFQSSSVETVRIPSSLEYVREDAFRWCSNLKHVYTCTIEPTDINENTFSNFETANLYVPKASGQNYYWDEGWKRFLNIWEFDEEYLYFYLNGDHTLDESTGAVDGTPEADLNPGSGLIVEEEVEQNMSDLHIHQNGNCSGSIIAGSADGNISTENLHIHINVESGRWYFFCFPFDLKKENISFDNESTQYVFRSYDGSKRAEGNSGWKNVTEENGKYLKAAEGYIFQCSQSDVLTISLAGVKFKKENKYNELVAHVAANMQDASWNFVGNPYLSYYDMADLGYDAPITVWNGYTYEAINPGDDDYQLAPFEAFFVQKPEGTSAIAYSGDDQTTYQGSQAKAEAARARRRTQAINPERLLVNITISNGEKTDRTRIVFNNNVSMGYEMSCDAAKFEAAGVPQLYTIDSRAVKYAINERPVAEGIVTLGYSVPVQGNYTLAAPRMDTPVSVKDNLTGAIHNFSEGDYEFASEAGVFEGRFTVIMKAGATGIDNTEFNNQNSELYNVKGQRVDGVSEQGIYILNNRKVVIK